jgi:hypothetical protein
VPIPVVIRDVTVADLGYGPRYCLECATPDGQPWDEGRPAVIPESQAKVLSYNYGDVPEGWRRHAIKLIPTAYNFKGQAGVTWYVLPAYLPQAEAPAEPAPAPLPTPSPPAPKEISAPAANAIDQLGSSSLICRVSRSRLASASWTAWM